MCCFLFVKFFCEQVGGNRYGLFLKGIGVTLDDSISLWRSEFTKRPDIDEKIFNSRYAYNIR